MRMAAAVMADFDATFLGAPSRLMEPLAGRPVLEHTLRRLARITEAQVRCLVVAPAHADAARAALRAAGCAEQVQLLPIEPGRRARRTLIRAARKWSLGAWRGGLLGTTWFDEFFEAEQLLRVLDATRCEAALCVEGHQAVVDPGMADAMLNRLRSLGDEARFVFTQAPPGLAGIAVSRPMVRDLIQHQLIIGTYLAYRPEIPQPDPITRAPCLRIPAEVASVRARLCADTHTARQSLDLALRELGDDCDAVTLCTWLAHRDPEGVMTLPLDLELELTTRTALPGSRLTPIRSALGEPRELVDLDVVRRIAEQLAEFDDRLVTLGGHGDPLLHHQFPEVLAILRGAGVMGIAVQTSLVELSEPALAALFEHRVDVLEVRLDADTPKTYAALHGSTAFDAVVRHVERIEELRRQKMQPQPLVACAITRCAANLSEVEPFYDRWIRACGSALIRGYSEFSGLLPPDPLGGLTPPLRQGCQRLSRGIVLLANGTATACTQDVAGRQPLGNWFDADLFAIWRGEKRSALRAAHADVENWPGREAPVALQTLPVCAGCREWFRR